MYRLILISVFILSSCNTGNLKVIADLPSSLKEVSGIETAVQSDLIWMLNDSGNKPKLYGVSKKGKIKKVLKINGKNHDWEDITSDDEGNLYIGDFGNNANKRKNLTILKVSVSSLKSDSIVNIERINFKYPNQKKYPPKKKQMHFDSEAFFWFNDSLYLFTKSRVKNNFGKTNLYKVPAVKGQYNAQFINSFTTCNELPCWITAADISKDGKTVVLLNQQSVWLFNNFKKDDFFSGKSKMLSFNHDSQKESICFKNDSTLFIADERAHGEGGNLYEFKIN